MAKASEKAGTGATTFLVRDLPSLRAAAALEVQSHSCYWMIHDTPFPDLSELHPQLPFFRAKASETDWLI